MDNVSDKMTLYICPDCKILLMRPEKKWIEYNYSELQEDGVYKDEYDNEPFFDAYVCPSCGNTTHEGEGDSVLKEIVIPIILAKELLALWSKYNTVPVVDELYTWGIPLSDSRLKEILTEELL